MKKTLCWLFLLGAAAICPQAVAQTPDKPMREAGKMEVLWKSDKTLNLVSGQTLKFELPPVPLKAGVEMVVCLRTRLQSVAFNGWNNYLALWINGRPVNDVDDLMRVRLVNRPNPYNDKVYKGGQAMMGNALNTFFGPSFDQWGYQLQEPVQQREKCWFILRVEDLLYADKPNTLELKNTTKFRDFGAQKAEDVVVVVDPLEVGYFQRPVARAGRKPALSAGAFVPAGSVKRGNTTVEVNALGGLRITHGKGAFTLESSFSYPNAGLNLFSANLNGCQAGWRPEVQATGNKIAVAAHGAQQAVKRSIELLDDRVDFFDTIDNAGDQILPVMALNTIGLTKPHDAIWVGGLPNGGSFELAAPVEPCNSTLFVAGNDVQIGIYAKDTVLRNQFWLENAPGVVTFGTNQLGIAPKSSVTLRWRLYLSDDPDYFSFINRIRADDHLNFTLLGPSETLLDTAYWAEARPQAVRNALALQCWRMGNANPWLDYYNGPLSPIPYDRPKFKQLSLQAVRNVASVSPGFFYLAGREISFFTVPKKADWSKLPCADSFTRNQDGSVMTIPEACPDPNSTYVVAYPALDNAYHKKLMADVDFLLDECEYKGIYFDIFTLPGVVSYDRWDGHSVEIDPKSYALVRQKNNVPILLGPAQSEMIRKVFRKGGIVSCNQSSASEEMQSLPVMSFVEGISNVPARTSILPSASPICGRTSRMRSRRKAPPWWIRSLSV